MKVPNIKVTPPGPKAKAIIERDHRYIATSTKTSPIVARRGEGSIIEDVDGNIFIDFTCGVAVTSLGHCHPEIVDAIQRQTRELMHFAGTDFYYEIQAKLAEKLCNITPGGFPKKVFFTNSGTESTEAAIKVARWSTLRKRFLAFINSFHGRTMGALALTSSKLVQRERYFPMMPGVTHIPFAYCYRCPYKLEYDDCDIWCAKIIEEVYFRSLLPPNEVAALFFEPIQGEGGYVVPPKEFLPEVAEIMRKHDILLVDDEVQSGFGRTGKMFATEHFRVEPDIITLAKAMGSGIPIGATVFDAKLDWGVQGAHSNTFGGNLVACASALATIETIEKEDLIRKARETGNYIHGRLEEMKEKYEIMGENRGLGLMRATEFVKDSRTKEPAKKLRDKILENAYKKGLILLPCGESVLRYIPALGIDRELVDKAVEILEESIKRVIE